VLLFSQLQPAGFAHLLQELNIQYLISKIIQAMYRAIVNHRREILWAFAAFILLQFSSLCLADLRLTAGSNGDRAAEFGAR
jgi:hypothetical protein